jgi:hypothetical protein
MTTAPDGIAIAADRVKLCSTDRASALAEAPAAGACIPTRHARSKRASAKPKIRASRTAAPPEHRYSASAGFEAARALVQSRATFGAYEGAGVPRRPLASTVAAACR